MRSFGPPMQVQSAPQGVDTSQEPVSASLPTTWRVAPDAGEWGVAFAAPFVAWRSDSGHPPS